jgi:hypothetical protein
MYQPKEVVIAGHSHIFAMGAPVSYNGPIALTPFECRSGKGYFLMEQWTGNRSAAYWDTLVSSNFSRPVILVYNGNQHYGSFLLAANSLWDFVDETDSHIAPGAIAVSRRRVKAFFDDTVAELRTIIGSLRAAGCRRIVVLGTPPPPGDVDCARNLDAIRQAPFFQEVARRQHHDLRTVSLTPARILLKMWRTIQDVMQETARERRALFVPVVPEAFDQSGFLREDFHGDIAHANERYGRLMLETALERLGEVMSKSGLVGLGEARRG